VNSIVDAHHHLWDLTVTPQTWLNDSMGPINRSFDHNDLVEATGGEIATTIIVQTTGSEAETYAMLETAATSELVGGVVGWVDLTAADVADRLAAIQASPHGSWLRGIRHQVHDEPDRHWLGRADVRRGLTAVGEAGLVFDLLIRPEHLEVSTAVARDLPEVSFVVDHIAKPDVAGGFAGGSAADWEVNLRELATLPNVACKLSGMVTEADWQSWTAADLRPFANVVLDAFGYDRVMYGSDWPVCLLAATYEQVLGATTHLIAELSASERNAVLGANARRIYRLPEATDRNEPKAGATC